MALTKRQKQVFRLHCRFREDNGYSPSYEEIARGLDLASLATVHKHIQALETKNYLKRDSTVAAHWNWVPSTRRNTDVSATGKFPWRV